MSNTSSFDLSKVSGNFSLHLKVRKYRETREDCIMRSFGNCKLYHIVQRDQVKEGEMGGAYSTHGRYEKFLQYFGWKTWSEETIRRTMR
jgi:hypothetical protein